MIQPTALASPSLTSPPAPSPASVGGGTPFVLIAATSGEGVPSPVPTPVGGQAPAAPGNPLPLRPASLVAGPSTAQASPATIPQILLAEPVPDVSMPSREPVAVSRTAAATAVSVTELLLAVADDAGPVGRQDDPSPPQAPPVAVRTPAVLARAASGPPATKPPRDEKDPTGDHAPVHDDALPADVAVVDASAMPVRVRSTSDEPVAVAPSPFRVPTETPTRNAGQDNDATPAIPAPRHDGGSWVEAAPDVPTECPADDGSVGAPGDLVTTLPGDLPADLPVVLSPILTPVLTEALPAPVAVAPPRAAPSSATIRPAVGGIDTGIVTIDRPGAAQVVARDALAQIRPEHDEDARRLPRATPSPAPPPATAPILTTPVVEAEAPVAVPAVIDALGAGRLDRSPSPPAAGTDRPVEARPEVGSRTRPSPLATLNVAEASRATEPPQTSPAAPELGTSGAGTRLPAAVSSPPLATVPVDSGTAPPGVPRHDPSAPATPRPTPLAIGPAATRPPSRASQAPAAAFLAEATMPVASPIVEARAVTMPVVVPFPARPASPGPTTSAEPPAIPLPTPTGSPSATTAVPSPVALRAERGGDAVGGTHGATGIASPAPLAMAAEPASARRIASPAEPSRPILPSAPALPIAAGTTAPAFRVFATAIHAARIDEREADAASAVTPLAGPTSVHAAIAVADSQGSALDMADHRWPHTMVDRIETLRDALGAARDAASTSIRLVPDALGTIDVSVRSDGDTVHVHFTAEQAATRALIADAQPRLTEIAEARGLKLAGGEVGANAGGQPQRQPTQPAPKLPIAPPAAARDDAAIATTRIG